MKRNAAKFLALVLALSMLLSTAALAATTYYIDVSITGPDAQGTEQTVRGSSSRYGTLDTPLAAEVVAIVNDRYDEMAAVFGGTALRQVVDDGLDAFAGGGDAWDRYVDTYYSSVGGSAGFKDLLKDTASTLGDLEAGVDNQVSYVTEGRTYTVTVTLETYTTGGGSTGGSTGTPSQPEEHHDVEVAPNPDAQVQVNTDSASQGDRVVVHEITPREGYVLSDLTVTGDDGSQVAVTAQADGTFAFTMPDTGVTVSAALVADPDATGISDVLNTDQDLAYMQGFSDGNFRPASPLTRGQVAMIFYRLLKDRDVEAAATFNDVPDGYWCADAVNTLAALGVVNGVTSTTFAPERPITRAQFVTICARLAQVSAQGETFTDVPETYWAYDAISTASAYGWVNGVTSTTFAPDQTITRAQDTAIINRLLGRQMAGETYEDARKYPDVPGTYWAWRNICEASNGVTPQ